MSIVILQEVQTQISHQHILDVTANDQGLHFALVFVQQYKLLLTREISMKVELNQLLHNLSLH